MPCAHFGCHKQAWRGLNLLLAQDRNRGTARLACAPDFERRDRRRPLGAKSLRYFVCLPGSGKRRSAHLPRGALAFPSRHAFGPRVVGTWVDMRGTGNRDAHALANAALNALELCTSAAVAPCEPNGQWRWTRISNGSRRQVWTTEEAEKYNYNLHVTADGAVHARCAYTFHVTETCTQRSTRLVPMHHFFLRWSLSAHWASLGETDGSAARSRWSSGTLSLAFAA